MTNTGVDHIATCVIYLFTYLFIYLFIYYPRVRRA